MEFTTRFELQSQTTRLYHAHSKSGLTGVSPSLPPCSKGLDPDNNVDTPQFGASADSQVELFPLQSPLLRESWLVSFPPLNYMLKFSGYSYLI